MQIAESPDEARQDREHPSTPGAQWIAVNGDSEPRCVVETTEVTYRKFDEVDAAFAHDEGEGDLARAYWRDAQRRRFSRLGRFSEDMTLMCERFRLVELFDDAKL